MDNSAVASFRSSTLGSREGLRVAGVGDHVGELYLADISVPPALYGKLPLHMEVGPLFAKEDVIRLW